jgi:hypothetical protein
MMAANVLGGKADKAFKAESGVRPSARKKAG